MCPLLSLSLSRVRHRPLLTQPLLQGLSKDRPRRFQTDGTGSGDSAEDVFAWSPCPAPLASAIYLSIADPLGQPAFKPSRTKPVPRWMQLLPGNKPDRIP